MVRFERERSVGEETVFGRGVGVFSAREGVLSPPRILVERRSLAEYGRLGEAQMTSVSRHERISGQLVDLKMPAALEALDEVIRRVDSGSLSGSEAIEQLLGAQIALRNNRRLEAAIDRAGFRR